MTEARADAGFHTELDRPAQGLRRAGDTALRGRKHLSRIIWAGPAYFSKGKTWPHTGGPQDQQHPGPGPALPAHGQETGSFAETGAGQHGVASATAAALTGHGNAWSTWAPWTWSARPSTWPACGCWGRRSGRLSSGSRSLKDATNEALRDWVATVRQYPLHNRFGRGRRRPIP